MRALKIKSIVITAAVVLLSVSATVYAEDDNAAITDVIVDVPNPNQAPSQAVVETETDRISYSIGIQIGTSLVQNDFELSPDMVSAGISDVLKDNKRAMTDEEIQNTMTALQEKMMADREKQMKEMEEKRASEGPKNLEAANAFLAENGKKEGVVTLPSGIQYRIIEAGNGPKPAATDKVRVHYTGTLINGDKFDSSRDRGEPAVFGVNQVIQGWQEALQLMPVGSNWQLFIPPNLAYGEQGNQRIPANSLLIFDVELIEIVK